MSAFRVQCETCQSWLKVRDEGFVGEVHACPKCGSMVLIAAPAAASTTGSTSAPAAPVVAVMGDTLEVASPPPSVVEAPAQSAASVQEAATPPPEAVTARASGTAFPFAAAIGVGVAAVVGITTLVVLWPSGQQPPTAAQSTAVHEEATLPIAPVDPEPVAAAPTADDMVESPAGPPTTETAPDGSLTADQPEAPTQRQEPTVTDPVERENQPVSRVALANVEPPVETPTPEDTPTEIDPLAIDLNEVEIVLRKGVEGPTAKNESAEELPIQTPTEPAEPSLDDRLAAAAQHAGVFSRRGATNVATGPYAGSSLAALAYVVPSVELRGIPLDEAMRLVGSVAGVPITIDPVALRIVGIPASKPIDVIGESVTLADLLATSLKPLRLGYATEGPSVSIVRLGADEVRTINHPVADLTAGDAAGLTDLLRRVGKLPEDVQVVAGKLPLTAPLATQYDLVVLCERLRVARGLATKTKYPRSLLTAEPSLTTLAPVLNRRTTFSFVEPTPLENVVAHWRRVTGLSILVDWRALADIGYGPRSTIECSVTNRPWRAALDGVLEGLGLTWAAIDGRTLWLTTHDAAQQPETIEFYPPGTTAPDGAIAAVDPVSGCVLVRARAVTQRELSDETGVPATARLD